LLARHFTIARKLPLALILSALAVGAGVGTASYVIGSGALEAQARQNLSTLAFERSNQLGQYINSVQVDLDTTAASATTIQAMRDFAGAWLQIKDGAPADAVRKVYLTDNPNPPEDRVNLDKPETTLTYATPHATIQPQYRLKMQTLGYADIYLFDPKGQMVYSAAKQDDFATNVTDGPYAKTGLGEAVTKALAIESPTDSVLTDLGEYTPSLKGPVGFFAKPIFNAQGRKIGVLAFAVPASLLLPVINNRTGMGQSGETLIVGADGLVRSDSAFTGESDVLKMEIESPVVAAATAGTAASGDLSDYQGGAALVAAAPVEAKGLNWALATVMRADEVFAPINAMRNAMLVIAGALLAIVAGIGFLFARGITGPISALTRTMSKLSEGELETPVPGIKRVDELGAMARAVEVFRQNGLRMNEMTEEERQAAIRRREERLSMMSSLRQAFGEVVDAAVEGDFSRRVEQSFPDEQMNALASSINNLVQTVETGLGETARVMGALARTDLTERMEGNFRGAFGRLQTDVNQVATTLAGIVAGLKTAAKSLRTATGELVEGTNDLSERTTRQAATIEETSATMEQLAQTVTSNAERAEAASGKAKAVSAAARAGGEVMAEATHAMERITQSSGKISNIIGLIDDIAFQTNLLALNASVEAARAGEAGKGFAVVAVEVRRLAQSAAEASSEVKALIDQSAAEVSGGQRLVTQAASQLSSMVATAHESAGLIGDIASASRQQASAIDEVSQAVRLMDEMTQHNAALVEETSAAIEQTEAQAEELDRIVEVFVIEDAPMRRRAAA
jgi:methyl-accepting chemotaxis protein